MRLNNYYFIGDLHYLHYSSKLLIELLRSLRKICFAKQLFHDDGIKVNNLRFLRRNFKNNIFYKK